MTRRSLISRADELGAVPFSSLGAALAEGGASPARVHSVVSIFTGISGRLDRIEREVASLRRMSCILLGLNALILVVLFAR